MRLVAVVVAMLGACSLPKLAPLAGDAGGAGGGDSTLHTVDADKHDGKTAPPGDGPSGPVTISGTVVDSSDATLSGVSVAAYKVGGTGSAVMTDTTGLSGAYALTLGDGPVNDYLEATLTGDDPSYWWFPASLTASQSGVTIDMYTSAELTSLGSPCGGVQGFKGVIVVQVLNAGVAVSGATVSSSATGSKACYAAADGTFDATLSSTSTSGVAGFFDVIAGQVTLSATKTGLQFATTTVTGVQQAYTATQVITQ